MGQIAYCDVLPEVPVRIFGGRSKKGDVDGDKLPSHPPASFPPYHIMGRDEFQMTVF